MVPATKLAHAETFDPGTTGQPSSGGEALITTTFAEEGGVTTVTTLMDFARVKPAMPRSGRA